MPVRSLAALAILRGMALGVDEDIVRAAMQPYEPSNSRPETIQVATFCDFLQTSALFVLDRSDVQAAMQSALPAGIALPRLPFRRNWIEWHDVKGDMTGPIPLATDETHQDDVTTTRDLLGLGISEIEPGRAWQLWWPIEEIEWAGGVPRQGAFTLPSSRLTAEMLAAPGETLAPEQRRMIEIAVTAADVITARNVQHEQFRLPRSQRKELERFAGVARFDGNREPTIYYVRLRDAGENDRAPSLPRSRRRVRWLVRGHQRALRSGRVTWVRAHVRGASWRTMEGSSAVRNYTGRGSDAPIVTWQEPRGPDT